MDLLRVHSADLHEHIAQEVGECLESGLYTDLAIRCAEGQVLHAHRIVLAAVSPYLQMLLETNEWEDVQTIEMSHVSSEEMQMLLEVVYNGAVEATIEDLRKLILLAHRLYISIPLSNELMQGLELKLPHRPAFRKPQGQNHLFQKLSSLKPTSNNQRLPLKSIFNGGTPSSNGSKTNSPNLSNVSEPIPKSQLLNTPPSAPKLNIDPSTMTSILAKSQNSEHICPICNSKYNNVGNFKQHMKTHDNEELREQKNAILSEMIATCFNPATSLYTCHVCNSNYNHSGNFKQHLLKHERESGSISATLVAQAGSNPHLTNVLQSAMADRVDSGDKPAVNLYQYQCEHCERSFKHPGNYKQHLASHMKSTKFAPGAVMTSMNKINSIMGQHKQPQQASHVVQALPLLQLEPQQVKNEAKSSSTSNMQMVACPECHLEFVGIDLLQAHISVSHKHLDVKLPLSQEQQSESSNDGSQAMPSWQSALQDQSQEPFKCTICGKGFQKTSKLTAHMKIHRAPEEHYNHPCDICGKKFTRPQHVVRHKMLHTGERPFKCPKCPRQFTREDKLRHHLSESECGNGMTISSPNSGGEASAASVGMFGSLWGGANGDMLANIYNDSNSRTSLANDSEAMDQSGSGDQLGTSEVSNDSNSNIQAGLMAT